MGRNAAEVDALDQEPASGSDSDHGFAGARLGTRGGRASFPGPADWEDEAATPHNKPVNSMASTKNNVTRTNREEDESVGGAADPHKLSVTLQPPHSASTSAASSAAQSAASSSSSSQPANGRYNPTRSLNGNDHDEPATGSGSSGSSGGGGSGLPGQVDSAPVSPAASPAASPNAPPPRRLTVPANPGVSIIVTSGHFSMQGIRPEMEDRVTLLPHPDFNKVANLAPDGVSRSFFAVFDGHGGDVSAEYCRQHVHNNLMTSESFHNGNLSEGLRAALVKTEADFCAACRRINLMTSSGTTAITAYLQADLLFVGNIGDSRAVLCRSGRALDASIDHKPGRKEERARIESLGGRVGITEEDAFRANPRPCPCLWACVSAGRPLRVFPGGLSVSRTIGDISMKASALVSSEPELWESRLTAVDEFLILACDGVWDVMNSQQAVDCVRGNLFRSNNNAEEASKHLANEAFRKGSTDNISVVIVCFEFPKNTIGAGMLVTSAAAAATAAGAKK